MGAAAPCDRAEGNGRHGGDQEPTYDEARRPSARTAQQLDPEHRRQSDSEAGDRPRRRLAGLTLSLRHRPPCNAVVRAAAAQVEPHEATRPIPDLAKTVEAVQTKVRCKLRA